MPTLLLITAFVAAVMLPRIFVTLAARGAIAWEDACRSRLRDRQWAAVAARWTDDVLRRT